MADDFKIRTLPRSGEHKKAESVERPKVHVEPEMRGKYIPIALFAIGLAGAAFAVFSLLAPQPPVNKRHITSLNGKNQLPVDEKVSRYMREVEQKREMATMVQQIENDQLMSKAGSQPPPEVWEEPKDRVYGLQLDQENAAEKVYNDLDQSKDQHGEMSPEERINARLAKSKWLAEMERAEQKVFVANFIQRARENGYEITLNDQLVVVKVKRLRGNKTISLDKILDELARRPASP